MKAICVTPERTLTVRDVPAPGEPPPEHVTVRMAACTINPGDKFFLTAPPLPGAAPRLHDVWGASGAGTVTAVGTGVPADWVGRNVALYRSLAPTAHTLGTWAATAQMPMRCCALIPAGRDPRDYSGSLVNAMTAYAFAKLAQAEGHRGVLVTAGTSATGVALIGVARSLGLPTVAIARDDAGRDKLRELGADDAFAQSDASFDAAVATALDRHSATAVFDGVGGALLTRLVPYLAHGSTIYSYGYLGGYDVPLQIRTTLLLTKALTVRGFSNFATPTVRDPQQLAAALRNVGELLGQPHFKTPVGRAYKFDQIDEAIATVGKDDGKPMLLPA